jgi:hypothetical protein
MVYDDSTASADLTVSPFTDSACTTALTGTVNTASANPALGVNGNRFSFTAAATGNVYLKVGNSSATLGHYIDVVAEETAVEVVRWATAQGYINVFGVKNTTNQAAHVTMVATVDFGGTGTVTYNVTIPPFARQLVALGPGLTINEPAGLGGSLLLTHDLPKNGVIMDAYFANNTSLVPAVVIAPR